MFIKDLWFDYQRNNAAKEDIRGTSMKVSSSFTTRSVVLSASEDIAQI